MDAPSDDLEWLPAWRLGEMYRTRELSPVEYAKHCLERIERLEPQLHAFITVSPDAALAAATRSEERILRGEPLGALEGIPVAVKDEVFTKGVRSTAGSSFFADFVPDEDGTVAARIHDAGGGIVGKANMPEFASFPRSVSPVGPESVNPWDPTRTSGASSGGSAAALAAGMAPLAVGSDGGGSIRIPSALCGVVGLYPTAGLVPARGSFSYSPYGSLGPIARDVRDVAALHDVLAGPDPLDPTSLDVTPRPALQTLEDGVAGMRLAFTPDYGHIEVGDPRVTDLPRRAALALEQSGAVVESPEVSFADTWATLMAITAGAATFSDHPVPFTMSQEVLALLAAAPERLSPHLQVPVVVSAEQYAEGVRVQALLREQLRALFERYDVLLSPTMPVVAPRIPADWSSPYDGEDCGTTYTALVNITGHCAASVPCGFVDGLPVGIHVIGPPLAEATVLRVARALELAQPWTTHPAL